MSDGKIAEQQEKFTVLLVKQVWIWKDMMSEDYVIYLGNSEFWGTTFFLYLLFIWHISSIHLQFILKNLSFYLQYHTWLSLFFLTHQLMTSIIIFFIFFSFFFCIGFSIHQHESTTGIHVFPIPVPSLWVVSVHQPQASSIMHRTWTGDSFHTWNLEYLIK